MMRGRGRHRAPAVIGLGVVGILLTVPGLAYHPTPTVARDVGHYVARQFVADIPAVVFAADGDSETALYAAGHTDMMARSWVTRAENSHTHFSASGWAKSGASTDEMYAGQLAKGPVAADVDVLCIMGGTNDIDDFKAHGIVNAVAYIPLIAQVANAPHVLLIAVPPSNLQPALGLELNAQLPGLAAAHGWTFVDPWVEGRAADGTYTGVGYTLDGVHPSSGFAAIGGYLIRAAIHEAASR